MRAWIASAPLHLVNGYQMTTTSTGELDRHEVGPYAVAKSKGLDGQKIRPYSPNLRGILGEDFFRIAVLMKSRRGHGNNLRARWRTPRIQRRLWPAAYRQGPLWSAWALVLVATNTTVSSPTGNLQSGRWFHTATLLPNGKVLVAGGAVEPDEYSCTAGKDSAELYDGALGTFASTGTMTNRRYAQTSTLLQNGAVLITGGYSFDSSDCDQDGTSPAVSSAEIYDPSNGSFAPTGSMAAVRGGHTATLLTNGKVLIAGGDNMEGDVPPFFLVDGSVTAEVYDPATGLFTSTGNMVTPRVGQTATLLANGDVLIAGGWSASQNASIAAAELYHTATGAFTPTGSMTSPRTGHTATLLPDGKVLIAGGAQDRTLADSDSAEIYDPATGSFLATGSMAEKRCSHTATRLPNGTVLLVGGGSIVAEIYDPSTGSFVLSGLTEFDRSGHSATLLQNGNVLVVGGLASPTTAELYP
jgi:hypothetical protein